MKTNEEIVEEFTRRFSYDHGELEGIALYPYPLPAVQVWLRTTLEAKDKECEERVREIYRQLECAKVRQDIGNDECEYWMVDWDDVTTIFRENTPTNPDKQ